MSEIAVYVLINGTIYLLVAAGLTMSYGVQGILDIANPAYMIIGSYLFLELHQHGIDPVAGIPLVFAALFVLGAVVHRVVIAPLGGRAVMDVALTLFGLMYVIQTAANRLWSADYQRIQVSYLDGPVQILGQQVQRSRLVAPVLALLVFAGLYCLLRYTRVGRIVRGTYSNREAAELCGLSTRVVATLLYGLSAGLVTFAALATAVSFPFSPAAVIEWFLIGFTVVIIGGRGSLLGPVLGALILGAAEGVTARYFALNWVDVVAAAAFVVVLILRPGGLFGRRDAGTPVPATA